VHGGGGVGRVQVIEAICSSGTETGEAAAAGRVRCHRLELVRQVFEMEVRQYALEMGGRAIGTEELQKLVKSGGQTLVVLERWGERGQGNETFMIGARQGGWESR
jgi:hypothetical protein